MNTFPCRFWQILLQGLSRGHLTWDPISHDPLPNATPPMARGVRRGGESGWRRVARARGGASVCDARNVHGSGAARVAPRCARIVGRRAAGAQGRACVGGLVRADGASRTTDRRRAPGGPCRVGVSSDAQQLTATMPRRRGDHHMRTHACATGLRRSNSWQRGRPSGRATRTTATTSAILPVPERPRRMGCVRPRPRTRSARPSAG